MPTATNGRSAAATPACAETAAMLDGAWLHFRRLTSYHFKPASLSRAVADLILVRSHARALVHRQRQLLTSPTTSFRTAGIRSASSRIRASSESRPSVSRSHRSGSRSGESRCGAFIDSEHGLSDGDRGILIWQALLMCFIRAQLTIGVGADSIGTNTLRFHMRYSFLRNFWLGLRPKCLGFNRSCLR